MLGSQENRNKQRWMKAEKTVPSWVGPASDPALAGFQAGSLGSLPGLGRLPGRLARGLPRPPARPWPVPRPAGSGAQPASHPAPTGSQAGVPGNLTAPRGVRPWLCSLLPLHAFLLHCCPLPKLKLKLLHPPFHVNHNQLLPFHKSVRESPDLSSYPHSFPVCVPI